MMALSTAAARTDSKTPIRPGTTVAGASVAPTLSAMAPGQIVFPGTPVALPLPRTGQGAVAVAGMGVIGATPREKSAPVASLTKIMTAYIVLRDHPLSGNAQGPEFVMNAADHKAWIEASESDESNVEILAGEHLSELQLLQALMIPSADNIADYLARWDAGSIPLFVDKMNEEARALGLTNTHYADASGFSPGSRSTAIDQARLAGIAMQVPTLAWVVDELHIDLPVSGEIWNAYNPAVGVDGIVGVKSGFTSAAWACLVTAAWRVVGGHHLLVISAVVNQPTDLYGAALEDEALLNAATSELSARTLLAPGAEVGTAAVGWSHTRAILRVGTDPISVAGWPGLTMSEVVVPQAASHRSGSGGWPAGSVHGKLELVAPFGSYVESPAVLDGSLPGAPSGWSPKSLKR